MRCEAAVCSSSHALADKVALPIKTAKNIGRTACVCMIISLDRSICRRIKPFLGALGHKVGGQSQHAAAGFYVTHAFRHNAGFFNVPVPIPRVIPWKARRKKSWPSAAPSIIDPCQKPPSPVAISAEAMGRHDHASRLRLWLARGRHGRVLIVGRQLHRL
jgi:hypothetical protein